MMNAHQTWYTQASRQSKDHVQTMWPWPYFKGYDGHLKWFLLNSWRTVWRSLTKFGTQMHQGKVKTKINFVTLTSFSRSRRSFKMISAQLLNAPPLQKNGHLLKRSSKTGGMFCMLWKLWMTSMWPPGNLPIAAPCATTTRVSSLWSSWPLWM